MAIKEKQDSTSLRLLFKEVSKQNQKMLVYTHTLYSSCFIIEVS